MTFPRKTLLYLEATEKRRRLRKMGRTLFLSLGPLLSRVRSLRRHSPKEALGALKAALIRRGHLFVGREAQPLALIPEGSILLKSGRRLERFQGYRRKLRPLWYRVFPEIQALDSLNQRGLVSSPTREALLKLYESETLPKPVTEYEALLRKEFHDRPGNFYPPQREGTNVLVREPGEILRERLLSPHSPLETIAEYARKNGFLLKNIQALDIGCGSGELAYRLAAKGAKRTTGLDKVLHYPTAYFRNRQEALDLGEDSCRFIRGGADQLGFKDRVFDLVVSTSVLEHLENIEEAFREMYRVLRPGGLGIHFYDPYFSPRGGHSLLVLDFPWGHVRLTREELREYLAAVRPHELPRAEQFIHGELPPSPKSLQEIKEAVLRAGFEIRSWDEGIRQSHASRLHAGLVDEVRRNFPGLSARDLLVDSVWMVLARPRD